MNGPAGTALLRIEALSCERDGRELFAALDLHLAPGDVTELLGPNGSGKSTLLRAVAGLFPHYAGTIQAAPNLYVGHRSGISTLLTAEENLSWYAALKPGPVTPVVALERVGMAGYERVSCQHLSAGQQRRVALARLLVCDAPLWLLDEPLTALDEAGRRLVSGLIGQHLGSGGAVLCATHQPLGLAAARALHLAGGGAGESP